MTSQIVQLHPIKIPKRITPHSSLGQFYGYLRAKTTQANNHHPLPLQYIHFQNTFASRVEFIFSRDIFKSSRYQLSIHFFIYMDIIFSSYDDAEPSLVTLIHRNSRSRKKNVAGISISMQGFLQGKMNHLLTLPLIRITFSNLAPFRSEFKHILLAQINDRRTGKAVLRHICNNLTSERLGSPGNLSELSCL